MILAGDATPFLAVYLSGLVMLGFFFSSDGGVNTSEKQRFFHVSMGYRYGTWVWNAWRYKCLEYS